MTPNPVLHHYSFLHHNVALTQVCKISTIIKIKELSKYLKAYQDLPISTFSLCSLEF